MWSFDMQNTIWPLGGDIYPSLYFEFPTNSQLKVESPQNYDYLLYMEKKKKIKIICVMSSQFCEEK